MCLLVKELRVMSRDEMLPTYRVRRWFVHRTVKWRRADSNPNPLLDPRIDFVPQRLRRNEGANRRASIECAGERN
jgi:hypothetical protein